MNYKIVIVSIVFFFCSCQISNRKEPGKGIIGYPEFKAIAAKNTKNMCDSSHSLTINEAISTIKTLNTISIYSLKEKDVLFDTIYILFSKCSFEKIIKLLDMNLSVGMSYHSEKYDLNFGAPQSDTNSYYKIDSLTLPALRSL